MASGRARKVLEASARVFGHALPEEGTSGLRALKKPLVGHRVASYYPNFSVASVDPLYENERKRRQKQSVERARRQGKGPPKKGEGSRQRKRK